MIFMTKKAKYFFRRLKIIFLEKDMFMFLQKLISLQLVKKYCIETAHLVCENGHFLNNLFLLKP